MSTKTLSLQVAAQSNKLFLGRGIARIGAKAMRELGLEGGAVVRIHGKRTTAAIALPSRDEDKDSLVVRLDGLERTNAGVSVGESVTVSVVEPPVAERIVLGPADEQHRLTGNGSDFLPTLRGRPIVSGNVVSTSGFRSAWLPEGTAPAVANTLAREPFGLQEMRLVVVSSVPQGIVRVTDQTEIVLSTDFKEPVGSGQGRGGVSYDDVGGIRDTLAQVREMIELPLKHPELFRRLGIDPPRGVLLQGPPGTGKTLLARAVASEADAQFFVINGPEIVGKHYGESEERLRDIFQQAQQAAPSIIFFDEFDSIAPKRDRVAGEGERRLVAQLLTLMDGLEPRNNVMVIGATNRADAIDEALRRPGRFDRELVLGVPSQEGRLEILEIHTRGMPIDEDVKLEELARVTYGFVGADLSALCREAAIDALRRKLPDIHLDEDEVPAEVLEALFVHHHDFENALRRVSPTALREIMIETPTVRWDEIGGLDEAKTKLKEGVELPLKRPEAFERLGIRPARGFLLYGPPGTGKTLLAKAVAREAEANFISVRSSDLLSKWYGESEKQVARLFARARQVAPTVIFIDEIDSLVPRRGGGQGEPAVTERVVNTILAEMDGLESMRGVVVLGATNQPTLVDPALLRPGRFDELLYVSVPDAPGRKLILSIHTKGMPLNTDVDLGSIADRTEGYTGADLEDVVRRAGLLALRDDLDVKDVNMSIFESALGESRPSVTRKMHDAYKRMAAELQQEQPQTDRRIGFGAAD